MISARNLATKKWPPETHIIGSRLLKQGSILVIGGPPKSMKSMILLDMAISLCCGKPLWGNREYFPIFRSYRVLLIENEIGEEDFQERMNFMLSVLTPEQRELVYDNLVIHSCDRQLRLDLTAGTKAIGQLIINARAEILMLDPLAKFHQLDENSAQDMGKVFDSIYELRDNHRISVGLSHHRNKPDRKQMFVDDDTPDDLRGSSRVFSEVDTILMLKNMYRNRPGRLMVSPTLRRGKPLDPFSLRVDLDSLAVEFGSWHPDTSNQFLDKPKPTAGVQ